MKPPVKKVLVPRKGSDFQRLFQRKGNAHKHRNDRRQTRQSWRKEWEN